MHIQLFHHTLARLALIFVILAGTFGAGILPVTATRPENLQTAAQQPGETDQPLYLPLMLTYRPPRMSVFGTEVYSLGSNSVNLMAQAGITWARHPLISWAEIEPVRTNPPTYLWNKVPEAGIRALAENNISLIATIVQAPTWAQKYPGYYCGPVAEAAMDEFAQFVGAVVQRYSLKPYRIKYWEFGNEPDVDHSLVPGNNAYGCWGDIASPYYGGGYYATMLKNVYPAAKAADPQAQIVVGGLLLDCDWTNPPEDRDCTPSKFLEGILLFGGGPYFDMLGFHSYANYAGRIMEDSPSWSARGGTMIGKIDFLRETMAKYGYNKPLLMNESSMVCPDWMRSECTPPVSSKFLEMQADYVSWLYVRAWAYDVKGVIWFTLEDSEWKSSGLMTDGVLKPAYRALQFTSRELEGATYIGPVALYQGVQGYAFYKQGTLVWVLWAADQVNHTLTLPSGTTKVYDKYGTVLATQGGAFTVNSPIYVELTP